MRTGYPRHLRDFDYLGPHRYFLTFCTLNRAPLFVDADIVTLVDAQFLRAAQATDFAIPAYCFMPDHVHMLAAGLTLNCDLKKFVARAKQLSGYHYQLRTQEHLWQRYSYEHVLRRGERTRAVIAYILENPIRAGLATRVEEYPHVRSSVYSRDALIEYAYLTREDAWTGPAEAGRYI